MSLEEAEAEMEKQHTSHFSGAGRLTQAIAKAEGQPLSMAFYACVFLHSVCMSANSMVMQLCVLQPTSVCLAFIASSESTLLHHI